MKVLIVSDTHKHLENYKMVLRREKPIDLLIHLGDVEGQETEVEELAGCHVEMVSGNNDFFSPLDREKCIYLGRYKTLITHGHFYRVSLGDELLAGEASARGFDMALFGHTHRPVIEEKYGVIVANPGSVSYPRQDGRQASYIVAEVEQDGEVSMQIKYL